MNDCVIKGIGARLVFQRTLNELGGYQIIRESQTIGLDRQLYRCISGVRDLYKLDICVEEGRTGKKVIVENQFSTSYGSRAAAIAMVKALGGADRVKSVKLNTQTWLQDENENSENWPCILEIEPDDALQTPAVELRIWGVTSGYNGTGPHDLNDILKFCGFNLRDRVFTELFESQLFQKS